MYEYAIVIGQLYRCCYKHPKKEVYERYGELGVERLRTDIDGALTLDAGSTIAVERYRAAHPRYWYGR